MSKSTITLARAQPNDYKSIALLQGAAFAKEEFGIVAFGPDRNSKAATEAQARSLAKEALPGETKMNVKAVATQADGMEEIVGFAGWSNCVGRMGSEEEMERLGTKEGWAFEGMDKGLEGMVDEDTPFGPGGQHGNARLREQAFVGGDRILAGITKGRDYMELSSLVVSPSYQRRGIGAMLFAEGVERADKAGLQVIVGASQEGLGLYEKYGCKPLKTVHFNLWEYEGGEGLGVHTNVFLHRPAVEKKDDCHD